MSRSPPNSTDTVIVGSGPSALILSYILHGNVPTYDQSRPHPDALLDQKIQRNGDLLIPDVDYLTNHFAASRFSYSTQALPVNVLLDTLIRPYGETDDTQDYSCIRWRSCPEQAVEHVVVGETTLPGGQWEDNPVAASWDIGTLSYAGMLSLPGYSFPDHYERVNGKSLPSFHRPTRREIALYLADYPYQVGIQKSVYCGQKLEGISRNADGIFIKSHNILCKRLVLASGIFSQMIPPRPLLQPLLSLSERSSNAPLLVIGSGFSAADIILSAPPERRIIHMYKWVPDTSPSPLRACHQQAYPDYAGIYRRMKLAATSRLRNKAKRPRLTRSKSSAFDVSRDWDEIYEGLPNTTITDVTIHGNTATIVCQLNNENPFEREIGGLAYVVGRRGSLSYLDSDLQAEICGNFTDAAWISGTTLRDKALSNTEVADNVFIIGSLTGDSLVRFAYGSCVIAAGRIIERQGRSKAENSSGSSSPITNQSSRSSPGRLGVMNGLDGHYIKPFELWGTKTVLDRRKE